MSPASRRDVVRRWAPALAVGAVLGWLYVGAAFRHGAALNTTLENHDQAAYLEYAAGIHHNGLAHIGNRNQMPLYPYLQSLVYDPDATVEESFERGKAFNIWLSVVLLAGLVLVWRRTLTPLQSGALLLVTAFTVFVFKAAYIQVELLYYALSFGTFLLSCKLLEKPAWPVAAVAGILAALTHLAKAGGLPAVALFLAVGALSVVWMALRARRAPGSGDGGPRYAPLLKTLGIVAITFLVTLSPYLITSKRVYGRALYSTPSTFWMWYDAWPDARLGTIRAGDRFGWPALAPDALPGPMRYLREHTPRQIARRFVDGLRVTFGESVRTYGYLKYVVFYGLAALATLVLHWRWALDQLREHFFVVLFTAGYLGGYALLYAWYVPIVSGNRFILSLFLPFMYAAARVLREAVRAAEGTSPRAYWLFVAVHVALIAGVALELSDILTRRIVTVYGGA